MTAATSAGLTYTSGDTMCHLWTIRSFSVTLALAVTNGAIAGRVQSRTIHDLSSDVGLGRTDDTPTSISDPTFTGTPYNSPKLNAEVLVSQGAVLS